MSAQFFTEWNTKIPSGGDLDPERHAAYVQFAIDIAREAMPELLTFMDAADAVVITGSHFFSFTTPASAGEFFDVPEMAARLNFLPWAEPHETAH